MIAGASLAAAVGVVLGARAFYYRLCLTQKSNKAKIFSAPHNQGTDVPHSTAEQDVVWLDSQHVEERTIFSEDDLCLHSILLKNSSQEPWVILCHGYMGNAQGMAVYARIFYEQGYQVLMPDSYTIYPWWKRYLCAIPDVEVSL